MRVPPTPGPNVESWMAMAPAQARVFVVEKNDLLVAEFGG